MLVLSRQRDETIMIGDEIEITIVDIRGDKVRLGITAPNTIPVHRKEVYEAIQRESREAAKVKMEDLPNLPRPTHLDRPAGLLTGEVRPAALPETSSVLNVLPMRPGRSILTTKRELTMSPSLPQSPTQ